MTIRDAADIIKNTVSAEQVAALYGIAPGRNGFAVCPFHPDKDASLKLYPGTRGWTCFGCHRGGSVIDFEMHATGEGFIQSVRSLNDKLGLHLLDPAPVSLGDYSRQQAMTARLDRMERMISDTWQLIADEYDREISDLWPRYAELSAKPKQDMTGAEWDEMLNLKAGLEDLEDHKREAGRRAGEKWRLREPPRQAAT